MNKILINNHSFVDVITNSSTELFVLDVDKTIDVVKVLLIELIENYNLRVNNGEFDEKYGSTVYPGKLVSLDDFDEPYIFTREMYEEAKNKAEEYKERQIKENEKRSKEGKSIWPYYDIRWGYEKESNIGKIILSGSSSNSIPYDFWDEINSTFNGVNYHLG